MLLADRILTIDADALVVDKPAGLPVEAPRDGSLSVESHLESLRFSFKRRPSIVHRLDRDTSGCLLLARNERAHRRFQQAFENGEVSKNYLAVLDGTVGDEGVIELALSKISSKDAGWRMIPARKGKPATTRWTRLAEHDGQSLVRFEPATGRTHQLRVHAASGLNASIVGDPIYGRAGDHMLLHAAHLSVPRGEKAPVEASAPLPPHFPEWARDACA
jgi:tRNA pseudouridine32 synthase/23S rRNA pseudouridine746 synthase